MKQTEGEKELQKGQKQVTDRSTEGAHKLQKNDNMYSRDGKLYRNPK